jgi:hypothetical protein
MFIAILSFLVSGLRFLKSAFPKPRPRHLWLLPFAPLIIGAAVNAGLIALIWNRSGLHRRLHAQPLSPRRCLIAGAILLCLGV